jgi:hypothetical protein
MRRSAPGQRLVRDCVHLESESTPARTRVFGPRRRRAAPWDSEEEGVEGGMEGSAEGGVDGGVGGELATMCFCICE